MGLFELAAANLISPIILSFALGLGAALARSDLSVPEAAAKALSLYLLFAIGFKGGAGVASHGLDATLVGALVAGLVLSFAIPFIAFGLLRVLSNLGTVDAAAVAGHYGSISIVTFVAATSVLQSQGIASEGYMVAVAAVMEAPAILSALWIVARTGRAAEMEAGLVREILLNGSIVLLVGSFAIGWITGEKGLAQISSFIVAPFQGVLCLFLLDMGLVAGRGLRQSRGVLGFGAVAFGCLMPPIGATLGLGAGLCWGSRPAGSVGEMVPFGLGERIIRRSPPRMRVGSARGRTPRSISRCTLGVTFSIQSPTR